MATKSAAVTTTIASAVSQFKGLVPVSQIWYVILYVPATVFGSKVNTPLASMDNGPVVMAVTVVFKAVTSTPFNLSFTVTLPTVVATVVPGVAV